MPPFSKQQIAHFARRVYQGMHKPDVAIIGGYHGVNAGDLALGHSVKQQLDARGIVSGFQTIYNLNKWNWPVAKYAIIGGGAVGYNNLVEVIAARYKKQADKVAFLGVDFNEDNYSETSVSFLKQVKWISCRSKTQAQKLALITERKDITWHPDIAFSLFNNQPRFSKKRLDKRNKLIVNIVPLYGKIQGNKIIPVNQYSKERPELYASWEKMQKGYADFICSLVQHALHQGFVVETLPFTPMDGAASKIILDGLTVKHNDYTSNIYRIYNKIKQADSILATRYHATIFSIKAGLNVMPFAYAKKNEMLLEEIGIDKSKYLTPEMCISNSHNDFHIEPIEIDPEKVFQLEVSARFAIKRCLDSLGLVI